MRVGRCERADRRRAVSRRVRALWLVVAAGGHLTRCVKERERLLFLDADALRVRKGSQRGVVSGRSKECECEGVTRWTAVFERLGGAALAMLSIWWAAPGGGERNWAGIILLWSIPSPSACVSGGIGRPDTRRSNSIARRSLSLFSSACGGRVRGRFARRRRRRRLE